MISCVTGDFAIAGGAPLFDDERELATDSTLPNSTLPN
jgi:hypothetical protein